MELIVLIAGTVVSVPGTDAEPVRAGTAIVVLEAMKMEHEIVAEQDGVVQSVTVAVGESVQERQTLVVLAPGLSAVWGGPGPRFRTPPAARDDLQQVRQRRDQGLDDARPEAVARRHAKGRRTARENLDDLLDKGSLVEYGPLVFAAQERRRSKQELIERTPADGLVAGVGEIDGERCVAMSYDYTVLPARRGCETTSSRTGCSSSRNADDYRWSCSRRAAAADHRRTRAPQFTVGWPTSEFGAMGLEGAVKLGMRRELEAIEDPVQRRAGLRCHRRRRARTREGDQHGLLLRDRRRDRSSRHAQLGGDPVRRPRRWRLGHARGQAPAEHRRLVAQ